MQIASFSIYPHFLKIHLCSRFILMLVFFWQSLDCGIDEHLICRHLALIKNHFTFFINTQKVGLPFFSQQEGSVKKQVRLGGRGGVYLLKAIRLSFFWTLPEKLEF